MRPSVLTALAAGLLLACGATAPASVDSRSFKPYESVYTPDEAVAAVGGGPAVSVVENIKSKVIFTGGGPCGSQYPPGPESAQRNDSVSAETTPYLGFYIAGGAAGLVLAGLAGWWLLRRRA